MRVLHVLNELRPSGAEVMLKVAGSLWMKYAIECDVLALGKQIGSYAPELNKAGYRVAHLPYSWSPRFILRFYRLLRNKQYDVIHLHGEGSSFLCGIIAKYARAPRVVRTIHNNFQFTNHVRLKLFLQRAILRAFGVRYVAIAPGVKKTEWKYYRNKTLMILNWFDDFRYGQVTSAQRQSARKHYGCDDDEIVLITVGNCSNIKNHEALLYALSKVEGKVKFKYLHVGEEQPDYPERKLAVSLGIADRVVFVGRADPRVALWAADIYVMPSIFEGIGIAALEAIALGLPALLSEVPGLNDLRDYFDSVVYAPPYPEELGKAIVAIVADLERLRTRAVDNLERAKTHFGSERGVATYVSLYRGEA